MIVSISRELGAGGGTIGEGLATSLGAALLDERFFIDALSQQFAYTADYLGRTLEQPPRFGENLIATLARATAMVPGTSVIRLPDEQLIDAVRAIVLEYAARGNVVIIGHGGVSLLGWRPTDVPFLGILLQAGREWRIAQLARRYGIGSDEARRRVRQTDEARVRYQQHYFNSHMYDCALYDLILNTETLGLDLAVEIATDAARALAGETPAPA